MFNVAIIRNFWLLVVVLDQIPLTHGLHTIKKPNFLFFWIFSPKGILLCIIKQDQRIFWSTYFYLSFVICALVYNFYHTFFNNISVFNPHTCHKYVRVIVRSALNSGLVIVFVQIYIFSQFLLYLKKYRYYINVTPLILRVRSLRF